MTTSWDQAHRVLAVLGHAPTGLGGAVIRMRASPDRDRLLSEIRQTWPRMMRISPAVDDLHLFGGVDVAATLSSGAVIRSSGVLTEPQVLCLTMAERCSPDLAAKLAQYLDTCPDAVLLMLDEGLEDEAVPAMLAERVAFHLAPEGPWLASDAVGEGPDHLPCIDADGLEALTVAAAEFGIDTLRAPLMAATAARALAGLDMAQTVSEAHLAEAAAMVLSHRATRLPPDETADQEDPPQSEPEAGAEDATQSPSQEDLDLVRDLVVEAVTAMLPPEVLAGMGRLDKSGSNKGIGAGRKRRGNRRGRPLPSRAGRLDGRTRLDILGTLRAAAPWQPVRRKQTPDRDGLLLRPSDFRLKRFETKSDRLVIFAVDASGSAAISRLNEAKGAIELLLGQAYAARDHVALVSFRGETAECLLPPTRSLVQTKRKLSSLPGGGGTPLASGLNTAMQVAVQGRSRGMTPVTVLVTDGKGNVALDGVADRVRAQDDALQVAKQMRMQGLDVLVIDMSRRPRPELRDLSQHLDGSYLPLPRADAEKLSGAVRSVLDHA